jgi:MEMO1 family protein
VLRLIGGELGVRDACGIFALRGLVAWAGRHAYRPRLLHRSSSAQATGDRNRVVGYCSMALLPPAGPSPTGLGQTGLGQR